MNLDLMKKKILQIFILRFLINSCIFVYLTFTNLIFNCSCNIKLVLVIFFMIRLNVFQIFHTISYKLCKYI
jgi:hypothetical protein